MAIQIENYFKNQFSKNIYNIILAFFKLSVQAGLVVYNLVDGIMDEFEDESGIFSKTNATYDATDDYYTPTKETLTILDYMEYSTDALAQAAYVSNGLGDIYGSDVLAGGTASADEEDYGAASLGCDNNEATAWGAITSVVPHWWKYDLGVGVTKTVRKLRIKSFIDANNAGVKDFTFQGSNNDSTWTDIYTGQHANNNSWEDYTFSNSIAYRYYKIYITSSWRTSYPNQVIFYETEMMESANSLQCFSEPTIKTQGSYSLKGIAAITDSNGKTLTRTVSPTIDLSGQNSFKFDIEAIRTGSNIKVSLHNATGAGYTIEVTPNIIGSGFQTVTTDISGISDANKNAIDQIIITIMDATDNNTFYIDNMFAGQNLTLNMTLISTSNTAVTQPTKSRIVIFEEDVDSITLNTDLKAYISRDGGTTYTQLTLADEGNYDTSKRILASEAVSISAQPAGTSMKYKIETSNNKDLKLHAAATNWGD
jgi:hypothetical protein